MICESIKMAKPDMSVIPAYASLSEAAFYVIEATERDFTDMIKSIGIHELGIFESTGSILLYEGETEESKDVEAKKEGFLVRVWSRIKAIFEKFLAKIKELYANYLDKATSKIKVNDLKNNVSKLKDTYSVKTFEYDGLNEAIQDFKSKLAEIVKTNGDFTSALAHKDGDEDKIKNINDELRGKPVELKKADIEKDFDKIANAVSQFKVTQSNIKVMYDCTKAYFDMLIKEEKDNKEHSKEDLNALKIKANRATMYCSAVLANYYNMFATNVKIVLDIARAANKTEKNTEDKKKEKVDRVQGEVVDQNNNPVEQEHESAISSDVESLFNWTY